MTTEKTQNSASTYAELGAQLKAAAFSATPSEDAVQEQERNAQREELGTVFHLRLQVARVIGTTARHTRLTRSLVTRAVRPVAASRTEYVYALDLSYREAASLLFQIQEGRPIRVQGGALVRPEQITDVEVRSTVYPSDETLKMLRLLQRAGLNGSDERASLVSESEQVFQAGQIRNPEELVLE